MKFVRVMAAAMVAMGVMACGKLGSASSAAVVDLDAVARALNRDAVIEQRIGSANEQLSTQLGKVAEDLQSQIETKAEEVGDPETEAGQQRLAAIQADAQNKLRQTRRQAQAQLARFRAQVIEDFRSEVQPYAKRIARERGAEAVFTSSARVLWFDDGIDVTDEVIAAMREDDLATEASGNAAGSTAGSPDSRQGQARQTPSQAQDESPDAASAADA